MHHRVLASAHTRTVRCRSLGSRHKAVMLEAGLIEQTLPVNTLFTNAFVE